MKVTPTWVQRIRNGIEGLVPRDSALSANVHLAAGAAVVNTAIFGGATFFPEKDAERPERFDKQDWRTASAYGSAAALGALFLTAGSQLSLPTQQALPRGITPMYFLAAGSLFGAAWLGIPLTLALGD